MDGIPRCRRGRCAHPGWLVVPVSRGLRAEHGRAAADQVHWQEDRSQPAPGAGREPPGDFPPADRRGRRDRPCRRPRRAGAGLAGATRHRCTVRPAARTGATRLGHGAHGRLCIRRERDAGRTVPGLAGVPDSAGRRAQDAIGGS